MFYDKKLNKIGVKSNLWNETIENKIETIIKTKFILDKNHQYEFDVDNNISMYALKRMITAATETDNSHLSSIEIK